MSVVPDMGLPNTMSEAEYEAPVSSLSTEREDLVDKMAQYAAAGIPA